MKFIKKTKERKLLGKERCKIIVVKTNMIDSTHKVELSHNQSKTTWYITFEGEFYTEFTFYSKIDAEKMYEASLNSELYMDYAAQTGGNDE